MKPKSPFIQSFNQLPDELPIYVLENALLPGGELPLELAEPGELALFLGALKTDQLIGMVQPRDGKQKQSIYQTGCAGRIRQYRERKDGRLNVMLTGICRYRIIGDLSEQQGYTTARVEWHEYADDYREERVAATVIKHFMDTLRSYFKRHNMQVDWKVLDKLPIEQVVNNLVLVLNLDVESKQQLLESSTVTQRLELFSRLLESKVDPILVSSPQGKQVN